MTEPLCTCGKRPKHKCCEESEHNSEESEHNSGKMCLKDLEEDLRQSLFKKIAYGISDSEISDNDRDIVSKTTLMHILEQKEVYNAQSINLKGLSEATEDRMSKIDRDLRQLRKEIEEELEKYASVKQK